MQPTAPIPLTTRVEIPALLVCGMLVLVSPAFADDEPLPVDGLSILTGGLQGDESVASAVLESDVQLEARLILVRKHGDAWSAVDLDSTLVRNARRSATYIRLLARQARQIGETVDPEARVAMRDNLEALAGGQTSMEDLVTRSGARMEDLSLWIDDSVLAIAQLTYMRERTEPPSQKEMERLFGAGGHPFVGQKLSSVSRRFRRYLMDKKVRIVLDDWLRSTLEHRRIRLLR